VSVKVAILVGVVLVVLFVGSVMVGARRDDGSSTGSNGLVDRLASVAGDPSAVARADVVAGCVDDEDPDLLVVTGGCTVVVRNESDLRLLRMLAVDAIEVEAPAPEGDLDVESEVGAGEEVSVAVGEGETEIDIDCIGIGLTECRARLVAE
jgi:transcription elongation GreA/GreB family factor